MAVHNSPLPIVSLEPSLYKLYYYPLNASMAPRFVLEALGASHAG